MSHRPTKITTLLKLFYSLFKSDSVDKEQTYNTTTSEEEETVYASNSEVDEPDLETSQKSPMVKEKSKIDLITSEDRPEIGEKNKWLYPTDEFGKMEHGVVGDESKEPSKKEKKQN